MNLAVTNTFIPNTTIRSAEVNENFADIVNWANGNIGADNIDVLIDTITFNVGGSDIALNIVSTSDEPAIEIDMAGSAPAIAISNTGTSQAINISNTASGDTALDIEQSAAHPAIHLNQHGDSPALTIDHDGAASQTSASALTVTTTTKGVLLPRLTSAQRNAIVATEKGLTVYDTDVNSYLVHDGAIWQTLTITPVGTVIDFTGIDSPTGYLECDASAVSRTTYAELFTAITSIRIGTRSSGNAAVTGFASTAGLRVGMKIEATGFIAGTVISTIDSNTQVTLSNTATGNGSTSVRFFAHGNGDGSTTFNVPDLRRRVIVGRGGTGTSTLANGVGASGGEETHLLTGPESGVQSHNHDITDSGHSHTMRGTTTGGALGGISLENRDVASITTPAGGWTTTSDTTGITINVSGNVNAGTAHNNMQPSLVAIKLIKY